MEHHSAAPLNALTKGLLAVYFASAAVFAIMLVWLAIKVISSAVGSQAFVVPPPPGRLLLAACLLMLVAKLAAGWAHRKAGRPAKR
jgi:hypothetical protein